MSVKYETNQKLEKKDIFSDCFCAVSKGNYQSGK